MSSSVTVMAASPTARIASGTPYLKTLKFRTFYLTRAADVFADGPLKTLKFRTFSLTRAADIFADGPLKTLKFHMFFLTHAAYVFADGPISF